MHDASIHMYSAAKQHYYRQLSLLQFQIALKYRAKCGTKPLRLLISTTSAQHSANSIRGRMDAPPAWSQSITP